MIQHAMETGYNVGKMCSNPDELARVEISRCKGSRRMFNRIGHILIYDDQRRKYFLIRTNNESFDHQVRLTISELPVPPGFHDNPRALR